jgi:hypothetical protein
LAVLKKAGRLKNARPHTLSLGSAYFVDDFALAASQSALVIETQPVPLQLFIPLQLFFADLHSDVPLQEFTPEQCILAASAATETVANPAVNSIAAAVANAALDSLLICII